MVSELPVLHTIDPKRLESHDFARGWGIALIWGPPLALVLFAEFASPIFHLMFATTGILAVAGTFWFGIACLTNAVRCGRTHCWVDGSLMPILAVGGLLNLRNLVHFPWNSFFGIWYLIIVVGFLSECVVGSYSRAR